MSKSRKDDAAAPPKVELVYPENGMFTTYANHLTVGFTPFDIRIIFGEIVDTTTKRVEVEQRAHVTLSWIQAKALLHYLSTMVHNHELHNGEIKMPPGLLDLRLS